MMKKLIRPEKKRYQKSEIMCTVEDLCELDELQSRLVLYNGAINHTLYLKTFKWYQ